MPSLRIVGDDKKIVLLEKYDHSQKFRLWQSFQQEHEKYVRLSLDDNKGRDSFADYIVSLITDYQSDGEIIDPTSKTGDFSTDPIEPKTIYNFLSKSRAELVRVYNRTFRIIDAYLSVIQHTHGMNYQRKSFLETLGVSTSLQFNYRNSGYPSESMAQLGLGAERLFLFDAPTSMLPAPLQATCALVWLQRVPSEEFFLAKIIPLPRRLENAGLRFTGKDKSDWNEDCYSGIAVFTRDGLSCHLTSMNARIPLYTLIKMDYDKKLSCAFLCYDTPGYLLDYFPLSVYHEDVVVKYFENSPWIV